MAAYAPPVPFPGDAAPASAHEQRPSVPPPRHHVPSQRTQGDQGFYSTTTAPLRDREAERPSPSQDPRARKPSGASSVAQGSVIDRGRPQAARQSLQQQQRPSSFFGVDGDARAQTPPHGGAGGRPQAVRGVSTDGEHGGAQNMGRANSFFGVEAPPDPRAHPSTSSAYPDAAPSSADPPARTDGYAPRRSSFYGLDAQRPPPVAAASAAPRGEDGSPGRETPSNASHRNLRRGAGGSSGSGSGSHSSEAHAQQQQQQQRARYSHAPYAASRAASLYGPSSIDADGGVLPPPPAQLLDQSHLQVGTMASLLSHDKTLELYRQNAKKTNDPDIQFEFATFTMDVVADLEQSTRIARAARGDDTPPTQQEVQARQKQQALVAESISLLSRLATRGHVPSCYFLADIYTQGIGTAKGKRDYDKAFPLFLTAGKHGHVEGSYRAAQCLEHGWGTRKDWPKAVSFYRRAAVLSHTGAMHRLGLAELNGELGLSKRPKDGVQWLTRAAELADQVDPPQPQSLHELAILHEKGIENVVFQDEDYAAELLARAAELQYAPSAYKLGECYEYGKMGCPQDAALSIHYYNIAAQQNHAAACFALTAWYLVGSPGILPQSDTEAYLWAKKAADQGLAKAEYACGYFTEVGIGTYRDERDALAWFRKAAAHGDKRAMDRLRMAGQPLPPVEAPAPPQRKNSPVGAGPGAAGRPAMHSLESHASGLSLPAKARRLSSSRLLRKENPVTGGKKAVQDLSASVDAIVDARGRMSAPPAADRKGKGKEKALPSAPTAPAMPPMIRQRSHSQPAPVQQPLQPLDYNLRPVAPGAQDEFRPLAFDDADAAVLQPPLVGEYGGGGAPSPRRAPGQQALRMPERQAAQGSPVLGSEEVARKKQEREKVLQRRKNTGEDKDCRVM
ncbi:Chitin synthase 4 [Rhodotorula kratochvilovae]